MLVTFGAPFEPDAAAVAGDTAAEAGQPLGVVYAAAGPATALNEDPNVHRATPGLQQVLPPAGAESANANQALLEDLQTIGAAPVSTANEVAAAASRARATSFRLWQTGAHELEVLLESRIRDLAGTRRWALFLTALAIVISGGIA